MAENRQGGDLANDVKPLEIYYVEMVEPNCDARLGKLVPGQVVPMDRAKASRYVGMNVAVQVPKGRYDEFVENKQRRATAQQDAFRSLNDGHAAWDVSTYRDVLTAPEGGLRLAYERGIPLVNVHMLRDENGDPLAPDADIEDILDARMLLHPDMVAPLAAHDRSSVMGGGSPFGTPSNIQDGGYPQPMHPMHRAMQERIANQERMAQMPPSASYVAPDQGAQGRQQRPQRGERASRANRRAAGRAAPNERESAPPPPPAPPSGDQVGNGPSSDKS